MKGAASACISIAACRKQLRIFSNTGSPDDVSSLGATDEIVPFFCSSASRVASSNVAATEGLIFYASWSQRLRHPSQRASAC
jgi:hypothetical protein